MPRGPRSSALLAALAGLAVALLAFLLPAAPGMAAPSAAMPATCTPLNLEDETAVRSRAEEVDHVFVGRVDSVVRRPSPGSPRRLRKTVHRVTVTTVLEGGDPLRLGQRVTLAFDRSDDGKNRVLGERDLHLFFADDREGDLRADYCNGSVLLPDGLSARLQRTLEGYLRSAPEPPAEVVLTAPESGVDDGPRLSRVVAPGAAISLLGVLGLFLVSRLGRRR